MTYETLKRIASLDGKRYVQIEVGDRGLFRFVEFSYFVDSYGDGWVPTYWSGLYDAAVLAERDARASLPWLRDENSN
jgi:hypothetical protein